MWLNALLQDFTVITRNMCVTFRYSKYRLEKQIKQKIWVKDAIQCVVVVYWYSKKNVMNTLIDIKDCRIEKLLIICWWIPTRLIPNIGKWIIFVSYFFSDFLEILDILTEIIFLKIGSKFENRLRQYFESWLENITL